MSREIKFRAWDKITKTMIYNWITILYPSDPLIYLQYTGLKDSKRTKEYPEGQDIYEGDIFKYINSNFGYGDPAQKEYLYIAIPSIDELIVHVDFDCFLSIMESGEKVGNIHEHPNLLKS